MRRQEPDKIALSLRDLDDLFTTPEFDAANNGSGGEASAAEVCEEEFGDLYEPGIDYLISRLRGRSFPK
jgi:hypothetical protein